ncbi:MAG: 23S rRNA pseudouridine1911/1915/1917 synthase [Candidatus Paceibacteria bacterium]|jgi:23S rRNA pseudouridine1911/1915/1917 synthase
MATESQAHEWVVSAAEEGVRLDLFLASKLQGRSRSKLQTLVKDGLVEVEGHFQCKSNTNLVQGEVVRAQLPQNAPTVSAEEAARQLPILFEDDDILVVDKPAGLLSHRTEGGNEITLAELAVAHAGPLPSVQGEGRPGVVHRLDRETSGVMVLGKNEQSLNELMRQFREREVTKTYAVLVAGEPRFQSDWIELPLGRPPRHPERMGVKAEADGGRPASTFYDVQERFEGFTFLHCQPKTGRTHQIRVHLSEIEMEVIGDKVYRAKGKRLKRPGDDAPRSHRQMLHARRLEFKHPVTGQPLSFQVELPEDFQALLDYFRKG